MQLKNLYNRLTACRIQNSLEQSNVKQEPPAHLNFTDDMVEKDKMVENVTKISHKMK